MNYFELFVARRFSTRAVRPFSRQIIRIAIGGIALGLAVMICSVAILTGFKGTIRDKLRNFNGDLQVSRLNMNESFESDPVHAEPGLLNRLAKLPGMVSVQAFANKAAILSARGDIEGVVLRGIDRRDGSTSGMQRVVEGYGLRLTADSISSDILISRVIASRLRLHAGDHVLMYFVQQPMRTRKLLVRGIFDLGMDELDKTFVLGDIRLIQRLNSWNSDEAGGIKLTIADFSQLEAVQKSVSQQIAYDLKVYTVKQLYQQLFDWLALTDVNVQVILVLMLLVAGINMISALLIMILERTQAIGILKAMGSTNQSIRRIFLAVSAYLTGTGMLLGNLIGLGFCFFQRYTHFIKLNQETYYMAYVPVNLDLYSILLLNAGTLVFCLLMLVLPSYLISRINPLKAITFK